MDTTVGKTVMEHLFKLPCSKADQQEEGNKNVLLPKYNNHMKKSSILFYMVLAFVVILSGCSSSREITANRPMTYEETLDYLKVNKKERKIIEKITQSREFLMYVKMDEEYQKLKEEMGQEKAEKTKLGEMRFEMFKSIARTMDILDLSSNAMAAVWSKVSYEQSENNKDKTEK